MIKRKFILMFVLLFIFMTACGVKKNEQQVVKDSVVLVSQEDFAAQGFGKYIYQYVSDESSQGRLSLERSRNGERIESEELHIHQQIPAGVQELGFDLYHKDQDVLVWSIRLGDESKTVTTSNYTKECIRHNYQVANVVTLQKKENLPIIEYKCQSPLGDEYSYVLHLYLEEDSRR